MISSVILAQIRYSFEVSILKTIHPNFRNKYFGIWQYSSGEKVISIKNKEYFISYLKSYEKLIQ